MLAQVFIFLSCIYDATIKSHEEHTIIFNDNGYYPNMVNTLKVLRELRRLNAQLQVDCERMNAHIGEVNFVRSGMNPCRLVTTYAKHLKLSTRSVSLLVYPLTGPVISGIKEMYKEGEYVTGNCTAAPSNPPPSLIWYVNGVAVDGWSMFTYPCTMTKEGLCVLKTGLRLRATKKLFSKGLASFVCESTILALPARRDFVTSILIGSSNEGLKTTLLHLYYILVTLIILHFMYIYM